MAWYSLARYVVGGTACWYGPYLLEIPIYPVTKKYQPEEQQHDTIDTIYR